MTNKYVKKYPTLFVIREIKLTCPEGPLENYLVI